MTQKTTKKPKTGAKETKLEKELCKLSMPLDEMCDYTRFDVERVKDAIEEWMLAIDVVVRAAKVYNIARLNFAKQISNVTLKQGREMAIGLDAYEQNGDSTVLNRYRQSLTAVDEMRKQLHEKLEEVKGIYYLS